MQRYEGLKNAALSLEGNETTSDFLPGNKGMQHGLNGKYMEL